MTNDKTRSSADGFARDSHAAQLAADTRVALVGTRRRRRWAARLAVLAAAGAALMWYDCDRLFYHPNQKTYYAPADFGLAHEDVFFKTRDGVQLHGWFLPAQRSPRGTVIHCHGNAANITNHIAGVAWLPAEGFNVLLFDYREFGRSEGRITRAGSIQDVHAAIDYALAHPDVDPNRLTLLGQSLGGAVGIWVAAQRPEIKAVVVDATFGDYREIAARHLQRSIPLAVAARAIVSLLITDGYDAIDVVERIAPRPLLVIAGGDDAICPPDLGRALYERAAEPKQFVLVPAAAHYEAVDVGGRDLRAQIVTALTIDNERE